LPRLKCSFREFIEIIEANGFEIVPAARPVAIGSTSEHQTMAKRAS
jgi:hypothetical protein